ncbi:MAG: hypothetical protein ACWGNI_00390 [Desulfobacterales bacterium]
MTTKNPAAVELGRLGGKAGKGDAKRRSPEHYRKMVEARQAKKLIPNCEKCIGRGTCGAIMGGDICKRHYTPEFK